MNNYPDGIKPIIISGFGSSFSDNGSAILKNFSIPYSQVITQGSVIIPVIETEITPENEENSENEDKQETEDMQDTETLFAQSFPANNISYLTGQDSGIIGSATMLHRIYDNITTQEKTISSLADYTKNQSVSLSGFMPTSFQYNLDTIKILKDNHISFILSNRVTRPIDGIYDEGYRNPQLAYYNNEPTDVVMIPVSYPPSSSLYTQNRSRSGFFPVA